MELNSTAWLLRLCCHFGFKVDITMTQCLAQRRLESPASRFFCSTVCSGADKKYIKALRRWSLWGDHRWPVDFPHKRASNTENVPIWWRYHAYRMYLVGSLLYWLAGVVRADTNMSCDVITIRSMVCLESSFLAYFFLGWYHNHNFTTL